MLCVTLDFIFLPLYASCTNHKEPNPKLYSLWRILQYWKGSQSYAAGVSFFSRKKISNQNYENIKPQTAKKPHKGLISRPGAHFPAADIISFHICTLTKKSIYLLTLMRQKKGKQNLAFFAFFFYSYTYFSLNKWYKSSFLSAPLLGPVKICNLFCDYPIRYVT